MSVNSSLGKPFFVRLKNVSLVLLPEEPTENVKQQNDRYDENFLS